MSLETSPTRKRETAPHRETSVFLACVSGYVDRRKSKPRRGTALIMAMLIMATTSAIVVTMLDTTTLQFAATRNTIAWDRARYLAEAGLAAALCELENDTAWRTGITTTEFPIGSGTTYVVSVNDPGNGTVVVTSTGTASGVSRKVEATVTFQ